LKCILEPGQFLLQGQQVGFHEIIAVSNQGEITVTTAMATEGYVDVSSTRRVIGKQ
jgi:hypothetical protein